METISAQMLILCHLFYCFYDTHLMMVMWNLKQWIVYIMHIGGQIDLATKITK